MVCPWPDQNQTTYLKSKKIAFLFGFQTGTCALFFAAQGGFVDVVKELLSHGAPVDLPSYVSALCLMRLLSWQKKGSFQK